jgi:hypothetical protein
MLTRSRDRDNLNLALDNVECASDSGAMASRGLPAFGVIADARSRQWRHRRRVVASILVLAALVIGGTRFADGGPASDARLSAVTGSSDATRTLIAHAQTPQGVVEVALRRTRFQGKDSLCVIEAEGSGLQFVTPETCASYPVGPASGQGIDHTHLLLGQVFSGLCARKQFSVYAGVVLHAGLTAWLEATDQRAVRMQAVQVPHSFRVTGPLVYTVAEGSSHPYAIVLRNTAGAIVSQVPVFKLGSGFCRS